MEVLEHQFSSMQYYRVTIIKAIRNSCTDDKVNWNVTTNIQTMDVITHYCQSKCIGYVAKQKDLACRLVQTL
jgi:hypothetical protein